jgi:hypothetical protein
MQAGPTGEELMMSLFHKNAVFVEPFSGQPVTHTGHEAIRDSFRQQTAHPLLDMVLALDRVDMDGPRVRAEWTCTSSAFRAPMRGYDVFTIEEGKIARLEIVVLDHPG